VAHHTLAADARGETRVLGSRFIACAMPVADEAQAAERRRLLDAEFSDATHLCWALRLLQAQGLRELSHDAREPAGTAGAPILLALRSADLVQAQIVVARYFGGTKLGKGGLARAYRAAAQTAIERAATRAIILMLRCVLEGPQHLDGPVRHLVARHAGRVLQASYGPEESARLEIELPEAAGARLQKDLAELTRGSWRAVPHDRGTLRD
jgi:putative IMPACT (imprinted ancient) family translation regulator